MKLLIDFLLVSGIVANGFLLLRLARKAKNSLPFRILVLVFALSMCILINFYAHLHELELLYLITFAVEDASRFAIAPLLFLYIQSLFFKEGGFFAHYWYHFLVYILYTLVISLPLVLTIGDAGYSFNYLIFLVGTQNFALVKNLFFVGYLLISIVKFKRYSQKMKANYSTITLSDFAWIGQMLYGTLVVITIDMSVTIYEYWQGQLTFETGYIPVVCMVFLLGYLIYFGLKQSSIFLPEFLIAADNPVLGQREPDDFLSPQDKNRFTEALKMVMHEKQLFLNEDLTLNQLAAEIGLSNKKLSALLNHHLNTSFYDFINYYRIEEVKQKIVDNKYEKYSLIGIAHLSGFKSKSSFYRSFKKSTNMLPTTYRNQIKKGAAASRETRDHN